jgi:hypothetical protein
VAGQWEAEIKFNVGRTRHMFTLETQGNEIGGQYAGRLVKGPVKGRIDGAKVEFAAAGRYEGTTLRYAYKGTVDGGRMTGVVDLGEYGKAEFTAQRKA